MEKDKRMGHFLETGSLVQKGERDDERRIVVEPAIEDWVAVFGAFISAYIIYLVWARLLVLII